MPLQSRLLAAVSLLSLSLFMAGCGTIYSDIYSYKKTRYTPPVAAPTVIPPVPEHTPADLTVPVNLPPPVVAPPAAPAPVAPAPAAPGIPGL